MKFVQFYSKIYCVLNVENSGLDCVMCVILDE